VLAVACARYADSLGIVDFDETGPTGDCFIANMPPEPHQAVMFMPTGGAPQLTRRATDLATVQALIRGGKHDPRPAIERWQALYDAFTCLDRVTLDPGGEHEVLVIGCTAAQSGPVPLGQDENGRHEFSLNLGFRIHAPTTHRPAVLA
jgi:hypothetical protein